MKDIDKFNLVKQNTVEIFTEDDLRELIKNKKNPKAYWGVAPTGPIHIGYLASLTKIFDLEKAGIQTKIMVADVHAAMDDLKSPWEEIEKRRKYYKLCIENAFNWKKKPKIIFGSDFQFNKKYYSDLLKLSTMTTINRAKRAASTVVRMKSPKVSEVIYPLMQTLDEEHLDVDMQIAGEDHRQLLAFAREYLPKLGYKSRVEVMTPLVMGLKGPGVKMSASIPETSLKVYESEESIKEKIKKAYCPEGIVKDNPILQLCKYVVFPIKDKIKIERDEKYGGDLKFQFYNVLEHKFKEKEIHPLDLKNALTKNLIEIFSNSRKCFEKNKDILKELGDEFL